MAWEYNFKYLTLDGREPNNNQTIFDLGADVIEVLWEETDGTLNNKMTRRIKCRILYHDFNLEIYFIIHRGWSLQRFKAEAAHLLSISAGRIGCKNHMDRIMKEHEDLEEYWMYEEAIIEVDDKDGYTPVIKPNIIETDNRTNSFTMLLSDGRKTKDLRFLHEWRMYEIFTILFINDMIPNLQEDDWYFRFEGQNINQDLNCLAYHSNKKVRRGTIIINPKLRGGGKEN
jgi:hypothetical protein